MLAQHGLQDASKSLQEASKIAQDASKTPNPVGWATPPVQMFHGFWLLKTLFFLGFFNVFASWAFLDLCWLSMASKKAQDA